MTITRFSALALGGVLGMATVSACDLDVPDLNNPGIDTLESAPTPILIGAACTGLLVGNRAGQSTTVGFVNQFGILGRETYDFDGADSRFFGELLAGKLSGGSPFGGAFWTLPYANLRLASVVLGALDKVSAELLPDEDKSAIRGFVHTIEAIDLLHVIDAHDTNGAVIETDIPIVRPPAVQRLGAIVDKDTTLAKIAELLDTGAGELATAGATFPFLLHSGYASFNKPPAFLKFNRAIKARVAVYQKKYDDALTALSVSFLDEGTSVMSPLTLTTLNTGVYFAYSTKSGDATNALVSNVIYAHPTLLTDAQPGDDRLARKTVKAMKPGMTNTYPGAVATHQFTMYKDPSSPTPLIRNEELLLLKAEALFFKTPSDPDGAIAALNRVRTVSGKLTALAPITDAEAFKTALLYEARYSLLMEGGHRLIDLRRFGRLSELPVEGPKPPAVFNRNIRYPFPTAECTARGGAAMEPRCGLGSTDP